MILASAYHQNCTLHQLVFKTDVMLDQFSINAATDRSCDFFFFLPGNPSRLIGTSILMQRSDNEFLIWWSGHIQNNC